MRALPPDLVAALSRARNLEDVALEAGGSAAQHRAVRGTGALILAAVELGWRVTELADVLAMTRQAVGMRLRAARQLYGKHTPALVFDAPLDHPPHPRAVLRQRPDEREWLTVPEAAEFAQVHRFTIRNWSQAGLLPNTDRRSKPHLFLRADLVRVLDGLGTTPTGCPTARCERVWLKARTASDHRVIDLALARMSTDAAAAAAG